MLIRRLRVKYCLKIFLLLSIIINGIMFQIQNVHGQLAEQLNTKTPQAPSLNYENLLKLYIAAHADLLDNESFAWHYYKIYKAPDNNKNKVECLDLIRKSHNPVRFKKLYEKAYAEFKAELPRLKNGPTSGYFSSPAWVQLGSYDVEREIFPITRLSLGYNRALTGFPRCRIPVTPPGPDYAPLSFDNTSIEIPGDDKLPRGIPVSKDVALTWLDDPTFHEAMQATVTVRVDPLPFVKETKGPNIPGQVIDVTFLTPNTLKPFYTYRFSERTQPETIAGEALSQSLMTLTSSAVVLSLIQNHPKILHKKTVEEITRRHIYSEQHSWEVLDNNVIGFRRNLKIGARTSPPNINKEKLLFPYEWQLLRKSDPALARKVLEVFIRPDPSWEFYRIEPAFDPKLEAFVETSIFSREAVGLPSVRELMTKDPGAMARQQEERRRSGEKRPAPEFLMPELTPVMRDFILQAANVMPNRFKLDFDLIGKYDAANDRLLLRTSKSSDFTEAPVKPFPMPRTTTFASDGEKISSTIYAPLPVSAKNKFIYQLTHHSLPSQPGPGINRGSDSAGAWRDMMGGYLGMGHLHIGSVARLALDREVAFTSVEATREMIERAIGNRYSAGNFPVKGRIILDIDSLDIVRLRLERQKDKVVYNGVMIAQLSGLELVDENGHLIHTYDIDGLTSAAETVKTEAAADAKAKTIAGKARSQKERQQSEHREALRYADVVGIRIGMNVKEAERIIRGHMNVGWVGELSENAPGIRSPQRPYNYFKTFISSEGKEHIALFWHPEVSDKLMAVTRTLRLPDNSQEDAVLSQLKDKYGKNFLAFPPQDPSWVWTVDYGDAPILEHVADPTDQTRFRKGQCHATIRGGIRISSLKMIEGEPVTYKVLRRLPDGVNTATIEVRSGKGGSYNAPQWDAHTWKTCGPIVSANVKSNKNGKTLYMGVFDLAAYGPVYKKTIEKKTQSATSGFQL